MCEAGRIRHHLRHNLGRRESTILFVGFQAAGTLGRAIVDGARRVRISGHDVAVKAQVRRIDSYSAHADQDDIRAWIKARRPIAGSLFLTHGEADSIEALRRRLQSDAAADSIVTPQIGERYALASGEAARRLSTGRVNVQEAVERDWQSDYADFATNLKRELQRSDDGRERREAVRRMKEVLQSYHDQRGRKKAGHYAKNIRCNAHARVLTVSHPGNLTLLRCRPLIRSNGSGLLPPLPTGSPILQQLLTTPAVRDKPGAPAHMYTQSRTANKGGRG